MLSKNKAPIANVRWKDEEKSLNKMIKIDFFDKIHDCCCITILK